jgi:putative glutamine amidotransferase
MRHPLIGVTCTQETPVNSVTMERISAEYTRAVIKAGGCPVIIPTDYPIDEVEYLRDRLDGILLTGGGDIEPIRYRGKSHPRLTFVSPARDELELTLAKLASKTDWPLLGICRGVQVMNVMMHGTLYVNLPTQINSKLDHNTPYDQGRDLIAHEVTIEAGTRLAAIIGKSTLPVNSFHHQAAKDVAHGLKVNARAADGVIEGLELPGHRFFIGVQWHPECIQAHPEQQALFKAFIQAAQPS